MGAPTIAIVGSGPSGCYIAQFLRKAFPEADLTIFDRLKVPYGLVRFGVAPDHTGTKAVSQQFDRLFDRDGVKFIGNTEIGKDKSLQDLRRENEIVVLATGLSEDRNLAIAGEELSGVYGSGRITRLINGHPDEKLDGIEIGLNIAIVGHGNVAMDLIRLSLLRPEELQSFGVSKETAELIANPNIESISIVGRSGIENAKFDIAMVKELGKIPEVRFTSDAITPTNMDADTQKRIDAINELTSKSPINAKRTVNFHFGWSPKAITGNEKVTGITFMSSSATLNLAVDTVYSAIGFQEARTASLKRDEYSSAEVDLERGYLATGLYCVGWLRRGPRGTIPANRADAKLVCDSIVNDFNEKLNDGQKINE
ncbi:MAG: hypothetical protein RL129_157 [Actinomycetota bacterium]|jgi:ferredoxin--NADP+ reductase